MTDIQAAVGREQLKRLSDIVAQRRRLAARYAEPARRHGGPVGSAGACMGPLQLAKLLCAPAVVVRPAQRHAGHAR